MNGYLLARAAPAALALIGSTVAFGEPALAQGRRTAIAPDHPIERVGPPFNDDCFAAVPIADGPTAFSTIGATTDGPAEPACPPDGLRTTTCGSSIRPRAMAP